MTEGAPAASVVEVSLRDGLQNDPTHLPTATKLEWVRRLVAAGVRRLEVASFVRPDRVPQMADAEAVLDGVPRIPGVEYSGLVLNLRGLQRALQTRLDEVNVVVCASDTFGLRNQGSDRRASLDTALQVVAQARSADVAATVTIATAFGCPFEGEVDADTVVEAAAAVLDAGAREVCIADTVGVGVPSQVAQITQRLLDRGQPLARLRFHFHDTRRTAIANVWAALTLGVRTFDSSMAGIGGCPFAPRATGNVATEDLLYLLHRSGFRTGIDLARMIAAAGAAESDLGHPVPSALLRAGDFPGPAHRP